MHLSFSPMRSDSPLTLERDGDVLIVNDERFDFSGVTKKAPLSTADLGCDWLVGEVSRKNGILQIALILPHGGNAPNETLFPAPITVSVDGPIDLPPQSVSDDPETTDTI